MDTLLEYINVLTGEEWGVLAVILFAVLAVGLICFGVVMLIVWIADPPDF